MIKTSPYEIHTGSPAPRSTSLHNRILVRRRDDDDKQPRFQQAWFLELIGGSGEGIALHPDAVQRHNGEWRVSPLDDPESNLRELKEALALMAECDWRTLGCKTCQDVRYHKGWYSAECRERVLPATLPDAMWPFATTKSLLDTGADDAREDQEAKRRKDDATPKVQEPSSGSGVKRSNIESIRRADAEAAKARKRARLLEERRAAKRASAISDEMETMLVAAEAVLTETRETVEALTVSAHQQAHAMSHHAETTAESFFKAHKDMTVTTKEHDRKKQLDFFEEVKVYEEVYVDDCLLTHVMSGRWVDTMITPTVWRSKYTARGYEEPQSDEGCFAARATIQGVRMLLARCIDKRGPGHEAFVADCTRAFLNAEVREGEQLYVHPPEGWTPTPLQDGSRVV